MSHKEFMASGYTCNGNRKAYIYIVCIECSGFGFRSKERFFRP